MSNHPIYGPQKSRTPVEARVVRPRTSHARINEYQAKLGVGGIVADDAVSATSSSPRSTSRGGDEADKFAHALDPDVAGGNKMWVVPETAYIDHNSRIRLAVSRAGGEAAAVKNAQSDERKKVNEIWGMKGAGRVTGPARSATAVLPEGMGGGGGFKAPQRRL